MSSKQESEALLSALLPFAEKMLREHGEFYPYGGYMKPDGTIVEVGVAEPAADTERPKPKDLIYVLRNSLQELARSNECQAVAMVSHVAVMVPNSGSKSDAIQICIEHVDHYSAEIFFPYQRTEADVVYGETFAQPGKSEIFAA